MYNQIGHLAEIKENIKARYGIELECVVNEAFLSCLKEMRAFAGSETAELQCPVMRLLQIEEYLSRHVAKAAANNQFTPTVSPPLRSGEPAAHPGR